MLQHVKKKRRKIDGSSEQRHISYKQARSPVVEQLPDDDNKSIPASNQRDKAQQIFRFGRKNNIGISENVQVRYGDNKKNRMRCEIYPFPRSQNPFDKEVGEEKQANPKLDIEICFADDIGVAFERIYRNSDN